MKSDPAERLRELTNAESKTERWRTKKKKKEEEFENEGRKVKQVVFFSL